MSVERKTSGVPASRADRFAGVIREPERPRGPLMIDPRTACGVAVAGAGCAAVAAAPFALFALFPHLQFESEVKWAMRGVIALVCMTGVSIAVSASQRLSSVTGMRSASRVLAGLGLVTVLLWGLFAIVVDTTGSDIEIIIIGLAASGLLAWVAATIGIIQVGTPTVSRGLRRYRQVTASMFAIAAAMLISAIWLFVLEEGLGVGRTGAGIMAGVLLGIGFWVGVLSLLMIALGQSVSRRMAGARAKSSATIDASTTIRFACPGCATASEAGRGIHRCEVCGTRVAIQLDEPRCRCGYTLFRMSGDRCPECGLSVPDADRYGVERFEATWGPDPASTVPEGGPRCRCGYRLAGLRSDHCPECGASIVVWDAEGAEGAEDAARPDPSRAQPVPSPADTDSVTSVEPPADA
jgi:hypothetical protein